MSSPSFSTTIYSINLSSNSNRTKGRNKQQYNNPSGLKYLTFNSEIIQTEKSTRKHLNYMLQQMNLTDTHKAFHPKETEYTSFSSAQGTLSRLDHRPQNKS